MFIEDTVISTGGIYKDSAQACHVKRLFGEDIHLLYLT